MAKKEPRGQGLFLMEEGVLEWKKGSLEAICIRNQRISQILFHFLSKK
jgi:hypothetical protein